MRGEVWDIILGRYVWGQVRHYFGWVGVGGQILWVGQDEWGWVHCLIMPFLECNNFRTNKQFAFIKGSLTTLQLLTVMELWRNRQKSQKREI